MYVRVCVSKFITVCQFEKIYFFFQICKLRNINFSCYVLQLNFLRVLVSLTLCPWVSEWMICYRIFSQLLIVHPVRVVPLYYVVVIAPLCQFSPSSPFEPHYSILAIRHLIYDTKNTFGPLLLVVVLHYQNIILLNARTSLKKCLLPLNHGLLAFVVLQKKKKNI